MTNNDQRIARPGSHELVRSILLGIVILAAGMAIGASLTYMGMLRRGPAYSQEPEIFAEHMLRGLNRELNLTPQQRRQLEPILRRHGTHLVEIRAEARPRIVAQLEQLDSDIASVLDDDQHDLWQQKIRRLEEHFPALRERGRGAGAGRAAAIEEGRTGPHGQHQPLGAGHRRSERLNGPEGREPIGSAGEVDNDMR